MNAITDIGAAGSLACAQCDRPFPADSVAADRWRLGYLAVRGELDETSAGVLLCPDCVEDDHVRAYDAGDAD